VTQHRPDAHSSFALHASPFARGPAVVLSSLLADSVAPPVGGPELLLSASELLSCSPPVLPVELVDDEAASLPTCVGW